MHNRTWVAALPLSLLVTFSGQVAAEQYEQSGAESPRIVAVNARPEAGRTLVRIETTSGSVNYISYSKGPTTHVVDVYGLEVGAVPAEIPVGSPEVRSVRFEYAAAAPGHTSTARFVIERAAPGPVSVRLEGVTLIVEARQGSAPARVAPARRRGPPAGGAGGELSPARRIDEILTESKDDALAVTIRGDGKLNYETFTLSDPPRLVVDIHGVENHVARGQFPIAHAAVGRIRVSQFRMEPDKVARVVLDLASDQDYRLAPHGNELRIGFGPELPAEGQTAGIAANLAIDGQVEGEAAEGNPLAVPESTTFGSAYETEARVHGQLDEEEGTLISLDLKDADIKDVLRYFSEISGLNIILDPGVGGTVTVRLIDVPWNKALDIILKAHGYGKTLDGNVLRIATVSKLASEETASALLQEEQIKARPLITVTRPISYGDAGQIADVVTKTALSSRGDIIVDQRTNTLIIKEVDLPEYRQRILDLIKALDTVTPQVEIEARIVETIHGFARSFGVQWGFTSTFDGQSGSTTDFTFPNSGAIRGNLLTGGGFASQLGNGGWAVNLPGQGANGAIGFHLANITDTFQLDIALSALENDGKARVLSAPKITTQSNIAASIQSGLSIPIQTIANNTITVTYQNALLSLQVKPQVTAENTVIMQVSVSNDTPDLTTTVGITGLPPVNKRQATTTLLVPDGGTAVIGGVFVLDERNTQNRIPVVSNIPILGWLFKNKNIATTHNELLIFITPKIKRTQSVASSAIPISIGSATR